MTDLTIKPNTHNPRTKHAQHQPATLLVAWLVPCACHALIHHDTQTATMEVEDERANLTAAASATRKPTLQYTSPPTDPNCPDQAQAQEGELRYPLPAGLASTADTMRTTL